MKSFVKAVGCVLLFAFLSAMLAGLALTVVAAVGVLIEGTAIVNPVVFGLAALAAIPCVLCGMWELAGELTN